MSLEDVKALADLVDIDFEKAGYTPEEFQEALEKAIGLPEEIDAAHAYAYRSGEHGMFDYWYKDDVSGNYFKYTNAPDDSSEHDELSGEALMQPDQPLPHTHPTFYTETGQKRAMAVPEGSHLTSNPKYSKDNAKEVWFEMYKAGDEDEVRYIYLDADVRENLDLWVQYQLRVVDVSIINYRRYAHTLFADGKHPKDRIIGALLILADQGMFNVGELINAKVSDLDFIDKSVVLLGRVIIPDDDLLDFFTSLKGERDDADPLFALDTAHGKRPLGVRHMFSIFHALAVSPQYLFYWNVNHMFSRIMNRLHLEQVPVELAEPRAYEELGIIVPQIGDVADFIDYRLRDTLLEAFEVPVEEEAPEGEEDQEEAPEATEDVQKSLPAISSMSTLPVFFNLVDLRPDEKEFSEWLHAEPWHDITPEQEQLEEEVAAAAEPAPEEEGTPVGEPNAPPPAEGGEGSDV